MTDRKGAVWTERLLLVMILVSLAGTLNLVLTVHRRAVSVPPAPPAQADKSTPPSPAPRAPRISQPAAARRVSPKPLKSAQVPPPPQSASPLAPVEDPTAKILAGLATAMGKEVEAGREADRRSAKLEAARQAAVAESQRWKRRELLVRQQIAALTRRAEGLEQDATALEAERDVLARERDLLKAAMTRAGRRSGYAVLPYKGPNGTWRRPIVLECTGSLVKLQPRGPTFSMLELSPLIHPRSSPVVLAIAREMLHIERAETPDGAPAVPYLVFLVRPNGIRPYYEARARLEPLGIAFGYELIEQDLAVEVPDLDDLTTWDGTVPIDVPEVAARAARPRAGRSAPGDPERGGAAVAGSDESSPEDFVWPSQARRDGSGGGAGSNPIRWGTGVAAAPGGDSGAGPTAKRGLGASMGRTPSSSTAFGGGEERPGGSPAGSGLPPSTSTGLGAAGSGRWTEPAGSAASERGGPESGTSGLLSGGRSGSNRPLRGGGGPSDPASGSTPAPEGFGLPAGPGLAGAGGSAPDALPDFEPARDEAAPPPLPPGGGSLSGLTASAGALGRSPAPGAARASVGLSPSDGSLSDGSPPFSSPPFSSPPFSSPPSAAEPKMSGSGSTSPPTSGWESSPGSSGSDNPASPLAGLTSSLASSAPGDAANSSSAWGLPGSSGSSGSPTAGSGLSLPGLNLNPAPDSEASFLKDFALPPLTPPDRPVGAIEVPFEITVVCRRDDVLLHPGGYRLTLQALRAGSVRGASQEGLLKRELRGLVLRRAQLDPMIRPRPSLKFLVETNGATTFWIARRQLLFAGLDWPMSLQVAGPQNEHLLNGKPWP